MANLKDIRNRILSVKSIQQVTRAMKMVAAAKMRKAQERMEQARPYSSRLKDEILTLLPDADRSLLELLDIRKIKRTAFVVITSDRGLAASFNTNIIKRAEEEIQKIGKENVDLFCIGRRGYEHFKRRDYTIIEEHTDFWAELDFNHSVKIGNGIISHFTAKNVDEIRVVFNQFKNIMVQEIVSERLLPLMLDEDIKIMVKDRLYEPSKDIIVKSLIPLHLNIQIWHYLLESYASEQAARMVAMESATENAGDLIRDLTRKFNNARQAVITKEILEIVGGAEALKHQKG
ncbi:MAG: ATP synthase F1 subunit gamma [Planctomycetia bacterium]|nr:ATP synthase F1 subunit gamma [Planctomycetia bacterium]